MGAFRVQIVDEHGELAATWPPGDPAEAELIARVADRVVQQPVGYFRSSATVRAAVVQALADELLALKARVKPL